MKKYFNYVLMFFAVISLGLSVTSCSNDEDEGGTGSLDTPKYEQDAAKYVIDGGIYSSIEFTASGNYIIVTDGYNSYRSESMARETPAASKQAIFNGKHFSTRAYSPILYGTYIKTGENEYLLEGFGKIKVVQDGSGNAYSLEVTPTGGSTETLSATKQNADLNSDLSNRLCRTWKISKMRMLVKVEGQIMMDVSGSNYEELSESIKRWAINNGADPEDIEDFIISEDGEWPEQVVFTKSGTYMVYYSSAELAISTWAWENEKNGILMYSWTNDFEPGWYSTVKVDFSGSQCVITESYGEDGMVIDMIYYLTEVK